MENNVCTEKYTSGILYSLIEQTFVEGLGWARLDILQKRARNSLKGVSKDQITKGSIYHGKYLDFILKMIGSHWKILSWAVN